MCTIFFTIKLDLKHDEAYSNMISLTNFFYSAQNGDVYTSLLWCPSDENLVAIGKHQCRILCLSKFMIVCTLNVLLNCCIEQPLTFICTCIWQFLYMELSSVHFVPYREHFLHIKLSGVHFVPYRALIPYQTLRRTFCAV